MTAYTLADLQRIATANDLNKIAVLVNNTRAILGVAFGKPVNMLSLLGDIDNILNAHCHCGRSNFTDENGFSRGMCEPCSVVRCDATPCPPCPELTVDQRLDVRIELEKSL